MTHTNDVAAGFAQLFEKLTLKGVFGASKKMEAEKQEIIR